MEAAELIRTSRIKAGLTQAELARRLGTTQSAIARLERPGSNPRFETLERATLATGHVATIRATRRKPGIDLTLIARQLRMTPEERLKTFESSYRDVRELAGAVA